MESFEIPDRRHADERIEYFNMELLEPEIPEKLTHRFIIQNSEYSIESQSKN